MQVGSPQSEGLGQRERRAIGAGAEGDLAAHWRCRAFEPLLHSTIVPIAMRCEQQGQVLEKVAVICIPKLFAPTVPRLGKWLDDCGERSMTLHLSTKERAAMRLLRAVAARCRIEILIAPWGVDTRPLEVTKIVTDINSTGDASTPIGVNCGVVAHSGAEDLP